MSRMRAILVGLLLLAAPAPGGCRGGGADEVQVSGDRVVQALFLTARETVREIGDRKARGADVTEECRTARVLFVPELQPLHQAPVEAALAQLDRLCPVAAAAGR